MRIESTFEMVLIFSIWKYIILQKKLEVKI